MSYRFNYDYYVTFPFIFSKPFIQRHFNYMYIFSLYKHLSCYPFGLKKNVFIICFLAMQMFRRPRTKHISLCIKNIRKLYTCDLEKSKIKIQKLMLPSSFLFYIFYYWLAILNPILDLNLLTFRVHR
jgi:hypothetical protein